jgi:dUTP pyrophosphatase
MKVKILYLRDVKHPIKGTKKSAGIDLYVPKIEEKYFIRKNNISTIPLGIATEIPSGYYASISLRSSLGLLGIIIPNSPCVIDADYTGEWHLVLTNVGPITRTIMPGDRVAQVIFHKVTPIEWEEVSELKKTKRGDGGFGSTGK